MTAARELMGGVRLPIRSIGIVAKKRNPQFTDTASLESIGPSVLRRNCHNYPQADHRVLLRHRSLAGLIALALGKYGSLAR